MKANHPARSPVHVYWNNSVMKCAIALCAIACAVHVDALTIVTSTLIPKLSTVRAHIRMEGDLEYLRRMTEAEDPSKSAEWNIAFARVEKATPRLVFGRPIGPVDVPLLRAAIKEALDAGVEYEALSPYIKVADMLKDTLTDFAEDESITATIAAAASEAAAKTAAADAIIIESDTARQKMWRAFKLLRDETPPVVFGRVMGKVDVEALRSAIKNAREAGVAVDAIEDAEQALKLALGGGK